VKWVWIASMMLIGHLSAGSASAAQCVPPSAFDHEIPDGASASRDAMLAAQRALKAYDNAVMAYAACLRDSGKSIHDADEVDQMLRQIASRFNEQLQVFKQRNGA
jgi:hypothetical protein